MELRITGTHLPGRRCGEDATNVHVGIQIGREPEQVVAADAETVTFTAEIEITIHEGASDFRGRAVQGRPGGRFVYLSWGDVGADGRFEMFRRAKLMLDAVDDETLTAARTSGVLHGRLGLTDNDAMPRCAAVRPPDITWSAHA